MTGFKCNITGSTSNVTLAKAQVPRRCGADPEHGKPDADLGNCTYGAKQPFYWFQAERNNVRSRRVKLEGVLVTCYPQMFEDTYAPPFYLDLYNFKDGAQDDIFADSYATIPSPSPGQTAIPTPQQPSDTTPTSAAPTNQAPLGGSGHCPVW